ncbi:MAG: metalloregulator ArsR/SmtB family transcription factor [Actinomycetota bacterium]|nr:metalloregulator ArsR/SmtB family transcription factor [Actinomycetota bacterium]
MDDHCDLLCLDLPLAEALRASRLGREEAERRASSLAALADPTRLTIALSLLEGGELCVCDLAWVTERAQNLVSHHVRALRTAGLVRSRREGRMVMYALTPAGVGLLDALPRPEAETAP